MINEETNPLFDVQEFQHNLGIYFEKIGRLHYAREIWKLVIKLDLTTLTTRYSQIMKYLQKAKVMCAESQTQACGNIELITQREAQYLQGDLASRMDPESISGKYMFTSALAVISLLRIHLHLAWCVCVHAIDRHRISTCIL